MNDIKNRLADKVNKKIDKRLTDFLKESNFQYTKKRELSSNKANLDKRTVRSLISKLVLSGSVYKV